MYTDFYNLAEKPFDLTHSSRYLYLGEVHKEALAMLTYGVMERKGFVLLTGEVGTGKTTILRAMLNDFDKSVVYVHLANPLLSPKEFMNYLTLSAFRNRVSFKSKAEFLFAFEAFLVRCSQHQRNFLLVIDEAHKLSFELLEEIRLLSNMETADEMLLSIFLVGQPELNQKLGNAKNRALLQRISIRYDIKPLSLKETEEYIIMRLQVAGARKADSLFPPGVRKAIHEYSGGFPRMINILADNLLLLGYAREQRKLTPAMVKECFEDLKLDDSVVEPEPRAKIFPEKGYPPSPHRNGYWKWAFVALLVLLLAAAGFYFRDEIRAGVTKLVTMVSGPSSLLPAGEKSAADKALAAATSLLGRQKERPSQIPNTADPSAGEAQKKTEDPGPPSTKDDAERSSQNIKTPAGPPLVSPSPQPSPLEGEREIERGSRGDSVREEGEMGERQEPSPDLIRGDGVSKLSGTTINVEYGDTLDKLAMEVYGRSDEKIWEFIQRSNPEIRNVDFIRRGQRLVFPPLPESPE